MAKSQKIGKVFHPHKSFPGRPLNAASLKDLKILESFFATKKQRELFFPENLYKLRCLVAVITHESRNSEELTISWFEHFLMSCENREDVSYFSYTLKKRLSSVSLVPKNIILCNLQNIYPPTLLYVQTIKHSMCNRVFCFTQ